MCRAPRMQTPAISRIAAPTSDAAMREGEMERSLRRHRSGVGADILTSPLGLVGQMMAG